MAAMLLKTATKDVKNCNTTTANSNRKSLKFYWLSSLCVYTKFNIRW